MEWCLDGGQKKRNMALKVHFSYIFDQKLISGKDLPIETYPYVHIAENECFRNFSLKMSALPLKWYLEGAKKYEKWL